MQVFSTVNTIVLHDHMWLNPWVWNHRYGGLTVSYTQIFDGEEDEHF